jgi:HAMP domain-containing protein
MKEFPDSIREENFDPIAFAFIGANSTIRYFPPIGIWEQVPPDLDVTGVKKRLGPEANPERKTHWPAPYEDAAGLGLVMTVEVPVYVGDQYRGAFQIDFSLEKLVAQIDLLKLTSIGFAFYVDNEGEVIESEARSLIAAEIDAGNTELAATLDAMRNGEEGVDRVTVGGNEMFLGYSPMDGVGGSLGLAASVEEITASAAAITAGIEDEGQRTLQVTLLAMGALFVVGLIGATYLNRRILLRPIEAMVGATRAIAQGDFSTRVAVKGNDELAALGDSINQMTADIQREVQDREAAESQLAALFAAMTDAVVVIDGDGRYVRVPPTNAPALLMPPENLRRSRTSA